MLNNRVVLVVLDALKFETACTHMGFMQHLLEQEKVARFEVRGELPSISRPIYETILTGTPVIEHGIYHNYVNRKSKEQSIFHLLQEKGRTSAAAAYHWVSEHYQRSPFQPCEDRIQLQTDLPITNGIF
ncbi:MAG: alkaline phosphatase family protein, partial [Lysinibacillus sp.]